MDEQYLYIKIADCRDGYLYKIASRNLKFGVYVEAVKGFIGIRTKFGQRYLFTENHWDCGPPYGTVHPEEEIKECPIRPLTEDNDELFTWLNRIS